MFLDIDNFDVFSFGKSPTTTDLLTKVKGLQFDSAFNASKWYRIVENLGVRGVSFKDLIKAKKASARHKDLDDLEKLGNIKKKTNEK